MTTTNMKNISLTEDQIAQVLFAAAEGVMGRQARNFLIRLKRTEAEITEFFRYWFPHNVSIGLKSEMEEAGDEHGWPFVMQALAGALHDDEEAFFAATHSGS